MLRWNYYLAIPKDDGTFRYWNWMHPDWADSQGFGTSMTMPNLLWSLRMIRQTYSGPLTIIPDFLLYYRNFDEEKYNEQRNERQY